MTYVYVYRLTADTGLAPCVENGLLSLAVCKGGQMRGDKLVHTGLRYWVGSKKDTDYAKDKIYILGTYENKLLYLARVTNVVSMMDYFDWMSNGRTDNIYSVVKGELTRNKRLRNEGVHTEAERIAKDFLRVKMFSCRMIIFILVVMQYRMTSLPSTLQDSRKQSGMKVPWQNNL